MRSYLLSELPTPWHTSFQGTLRVVYPKLLEVFDGKEPERDDMGRSYYFGWFFLMDGKPASVYTTDNRSDYDPSQVVEWRIGAQDKGHYLRVKDQILSLLP